MRGVVSGRDEWMRRLRTGLGASGIGVADCVERGCAAVVAFRGARRVDRDAALLDLKSASWVSGSSESSSRIDCVEDVYSAGFERDSL